MGFRFRKSIKIGPARVNLSKSGIGYSVGTKGFRVTKKAGGGTRTTASIPGTGISYTSDSKKRKTATAKKKTTTNTSTRSTASQAGSSQKKIGCLPAVGIFFLVCLIIGLIRSYPVITILTLLLIAGGTFFIVRKKKAKAAEMPEPANASTTATEPTALTKELTSQEKFELRCAERAKQFDAELDAIPLIDVAMSDPVPRHLLKDIPEYSFSNITRTTRLDSIFPLVFLDVETTGFAPSKCEIIEVSAIKFETGMIPVAAFSTLCKPRKPIPEDVSTVNHITDEMVADAPTFAQIAPALTQFIKGSHIAGHNLDFDLRFIFAHGADLPDKVRFYDTLDLAHLTIPSNSVYNYKLDTVCHHYGIWCNNAHRSLSDCYATSRLFIHLVHDKTSRQLDATAEILSEVSAE